jgi:hypothetical protein
MFLETTPDTSGYMIAGYVIAFLTLGLYIASLYIRHRNLRQDLEILESMPLKPTRTTRAKTKPKPKKK